MVDSRFRSHSHVMRELKLAVLFFLLPLYPALIGVDSASMAICGYLAASGDCCCSPLGLGLLATKRRNYKCTYDRSCFSPLKASCRMRKPTVLLDTAAVTLQRPASLSPDSSDAVDNFPALSTSSLLAREIVVSLVNADPSRSWSAPTHSTPASAIGAPSPPLCLLSASSLPLLVCDLVAEWPDIGSSSRKIYKIGSRRKTRRCYRRGVPPRPREPAPPPPQHGHDDGHPAEQPSPPASFPRRFFPFHHPHEVQHLPGYPPWRQPPPTPFPPLPPPSPAGPPPLPSSAPLPGPQPLENPSETPPASPASPCTTTTSPSPLCSPCPPKGPVGDPFAPLPSAAQPAYVPPPPYSRSAPPVPNCFDVYNASRLSLSAGRADLWRHSKVSPFEAFFVGSFLGGADQQRNVVACDIATFNGSGDSLDDTRNRGNRKNIYRPDIQPSCNFFGTAIASQEHPGSESLGSVSTGLPSATIPAVSDLSWRIPLTAEGASFSAPECRHTQKRFRQHHPHKYNPRQHRRHPKRMTHRWRPRHRKTYVSRKHVVSD